MYVIPISVNGGLSTRHACAQLWVEYFRLELVYAQKLRARRRVLGINDSAGAQRMVPVCWTALLTQSQGGFVSVESSIRLS